jgi:WXG100 family type VII secretion target
MAEGINIALSEVSSIAGTIRNLNDSLTMNLEDIKAQMISMESTWQSDASQSIIGNFNALAPKFNNYREIIESYARFLDTTVASYRETETMINNNANAFK